MWCMFIKIIGRNFCFLDFRLGTSGKAGLRKCLKVTQRVIKRENFILQLHLSAIGSLCTCFVRPVRESKGFQWIHNSPGHLANTLGLWPDVPSSLAPVSRKTDINSWRWMQIKMPLQNWLLKYFEKFISSPKHQDSLSLMEGGKCVSHSCDTISCPNTSLLTKHDFAVETSSHSQSVMSQHLHGLL